MTRHPVAASIAAAAILVLATTGLVGYALATGTATPATGATPEQPPAQKTEAVRPSYTPPSDSDIPNGPFGDMIRLGEAIFHDTQHNAKGFVGNDLQCSNCHIDRGRQPNSAPLGAAYLLYPAYRAKNAHVNTFQERLQGCFRYSMNGKAPPFNDKVLVALESYAYFLAKGGPTGVVVKGQGYPKLKAPDQPADYDRGAKAYASIARSVTAPTARDRNQPMDRPYFPRCGERGHSTGGRGWLRSTTPRASSRLTCRSASAAR